METSPGSLVAKNLVEMRKARGLTTRELASRLTRIGHPILPSAITKIENRQRRVDVDDLVALAAALEVNPNRLLLPLDGSETPVRIGENLAPKVFQLWAWALGHQVLASAKAAIGKGDETFSEGQLDFRRHSLPPSYRRNEGHAAVVATRDLHGFMSAIVDPDEVPDADPVYVTQVLVENLTWAINQSLKVLEKRLDSMADDELATLSARVESMIHSTGAQFDQLRIRVMENLGWEVKKTSPTFGAIATASPPSATPDGP